MTQGLRDKARFVHNLTGYTVQDCFAVLQAAEAYDVKALRDKTSIKYGKLFTVEPYLMPTRKRYDINKGEVVTNDNHYGLRIRVHKLGRELLDEEED